MATTTNYGWETPDDTDLVKDGAAAIRTLGNSVDTTTKNLNPQTTLGDLAYRSATANVNTRLALGTANQVLRVNSGGTAPEWATSADVTPLTTKGDLFTFTTVDARLGIGANNTVLTADSAEATGMKWAAPAATATNYTLLNSGGTALTGATTITISGLSGYNKYHIRIEGASTVDPSAPIAFRFNSDTNNLFQATGIQFNGSTLGVVYGDDNRIIIGETGNTAADDLYCNIQVDGANSAGLKSFVFSTAGSGSSAVTTPGMVGHYRGTSVISSLNLLSLSGNFDAGTVYVYGA